MIKMRKDFTGRKKYIVHKRFTEKKDFFGKKLVSVHSLVTGGFYFRNDLV